MVFEDLGLLFFTSLILSLLLTPMSISFAHWIGAVDMPCERSVHTRSITRLGGLGLVLSSTVSVVLFVDFTKEIESFLLGVIVIALTGMLDDLYNIRPYQKMLGQVFACVLFVVVSGLDLHFFGDLLGWGDIRLPSMIAVPFTIFCMVGVINAFNLSDGLDGLAAGITMVSSLFMLVLAIQYHNVTALWVILAFLGGVLGFLKFNTHPAKLFMGDTGSLTLGFLMACLLVILSKGNNDGGQVVTLWLLLALPISDTLLVMSRRMLSGKSPVSPDKTHLHHRLLNLGMSHAMVVIVMYAITLVFGLLALLVQHDPAWQQLLLAFIFCGTLYFSLSLCERKEWRVSESSFIWFESKSLSSGLTSVAGKSVKFLRIFILVGLAIPFFFVTSPQESISPVLWSVFVLFFLAYPWRDHVDRASVAHALFYLAGVAVLYAWNTLEFDGFPFFWYQLFFMLILFVWSAFKIRFKGHREVFLTSGFEVLLIAVAWFIPYVLLPSLQVNENVMNAVKLSCMEAIPLLIAIKLAVRRQPDRNRMMAIGLLALLAFAAWQAL